MPNSLLLAVLIGASATPVYAAAGTQEQVKGVFGVIEKDTTWQGHIAVVQPLTIAGATLTVQPGTTIEFSPRATEATAKIVLERRRLQLARLLLNGTPEEPIVVRTPPGAPAGAIVTAGARGGTFLARHVRFIGLGGRPRSDQTSLGAEPGIAIRLVEPDDTVRIEDCYFERCGPLTIAADHDRAAAAVRRSWFAAGTAPQALVLEGTGPGTKTIVGSHFDAAIQAWSSETKITDNVLIGRHASISVPARDADGILIRDNYVHNTTDTDEGTYCLLCRCPTAAIRNNVLIGGTWAIQVASRDVQGNVLIGVGGLASKVLAKATTTHQLIADLPPGAVVSRNLLLGPAHSLLATTAGARDVQIVHNVFDGMARSARAIHLNALATEPVRAMIRNNLILRTSRPPIFDEYGGPETVASCDYNAFAECGDHRFENVQPPSKRQGRPGWGASDLIVRSLRDLKLAGTPTTVPASLEASLRAGQTTPQDVRKRLLAAYEPQPDSPLVDAGDASASRAPDEKPDIGAVELGAKPARRPAAGQ